MSDGYQLGVGWVSDGWVYDVLGRCPLLSEVCLAVRIHQHSHDIVARCEHATCVRGVSDVGQMSSDGYQLGVRWVSDGWMRARDLSLGSRLGSEPVVGIDPGVCVYLECNAAFSIMFGAGTVVLNQRKRRV